MNSVLKLAAIVLILGAVAGADQWEFFFPEQVISFGCKAALTQISEHGGRSREVWDAEAEATRKEEGNWAMTVGMFPPDLKGRHQAEKACSKWMDEASKRVKKAQ